MPTLLLVVQVAIGLGIYNVWLLRGGRETAWRGGDARTLREEFEVYGLPGWFFGTIGFLKLLFATALIAGVWWPVFTLPAAIGMAVLMAGAVAMHVKVGDPPIRALPAGTLLVLSIVVAAMAAV